MTVNNNQFLSFRWAKKIQNLGFNLSTLFVWGLQQQVRPEIIKKYGALSDDGYYELTEDCGCGGTLKFKEVYYNKRVLVERDGRYYFSINENKIVAAPSYSTVGQWLYDYKKLFVNVNFKYHTEEEINCNGEVYIKRYDKPKIIGYYYDVWNLNTVENCTSDAIYHSPAEAYKAGICEAIKFLENLKKE